MKHRIIIGEWVGTTVLCSSLPHKFLADWRQARRWESVEAALAAAAAQRALLLPAELWGWHCRSSWVLRCSLLHPVGAVFPSLRRAPRLGDWKDKASMMMVSARW